MVNNMGFLLPPKEKVIARKFCEMIHEVSLVHDEKIVQLSVQKYLEQLYGEGKDAQVKAIEKQMKHCNPNLSKKLFFK